MALETDIAHRFRIAGKIGAGGMGEVYRARDLRLGREVALKVLPAEVATDPDRVRRFEHEARAAAALNHPNILALHDVGEHNGTHYLVTELLEGESLRERIAHGPLPVKEAVRISIQIARGLAAAHGKGIVHRDLKPENLFVTTDGTVKILDFGLASLRGEAGGEAPSTESPTETGMTRAGTVLGTAGYMAPEQVRGQRVDQRADIFAIGCVLYEMLTGRRAFSGDTPADTLSAILKEEPASVETLAGGVSQPQAELVRRCLEKRPEDRFSSAHDLALALAAAVSDVDPRLASAVTAAQPLPRRRRALVGIAAALLLLAVAIAVALWLRSGHLGGGSAAALDPTKVMVAPFENVSGDPSLAAVAVQVADGINRGLVEVGGIVPVPAPRGLRSGDEQALRAAARQAGAGVLASGSIFATGDTVELAGRISDVASGKLLYALEPERGPRQQPADAIDRVRQRAMSAALMHMGWTGDLGGVTRPPLYSALKEWAAGAELTGKDWAAAVEHLERAVALDPAFWQPKGHLLYAYRWFMGDMDKLDALRREIAASQDRMCDADRLYMLLGEALVDSMPLEGLRRVRELLALAPRDTGYRLHGAMLALNLNRPREALEFLGDVKEIDWASLRPPARTPSYFGWAATAHHLLGEYEAELDVARFGLGIFPDSLKLRSREVGALAALGRVAELEAVIGEVLQVQAEDATPGEVILNAAQELRAHGHPDDARRMAARGVDWYAGRTGKDVDPNARLLCLVLAERPEEARALARQQYEADPEDVLALGFSGALAARLGDRASAEAVDAQIARDGPAPATRARLRAYIAAQLGDNERTVALLRDSLARGRTYFELHVDPFLEPLHGYPPFEELIRPKG